MKKGSLKLSFAFGEWYMKKRGRAVGGVAVHLAGLLGGPPGVTLPYDIPQPLGLCGWTFLPAVDEIFVIEDMSKDSRCVR